MIQYLPSAYLSLIQCVVVLLIHPSMYRYINTYIIISIGVGKASVLGGTISCACAHGHAARLCDFIRRRRCLVSIPSKKKLSFASHPPSRQRKYVRKGVATSDWAQHMTKSWGGTCPRFLYTPMNKTCMHERRSVHSTLYVLSMPTAFYVEESQPQTFSINGFHPV